MRENHQGSNDGFILDTQLRFHIYLAHGIGSSYEFNKWSGVEPGAGTAGWLAEGMKQGWQTWGGED